MPALRFPRGFATGVGHFNAGRYFEAHEAFEDLLDEVEEDGRWDLLVALVQVAVGYHKATAGHPGAERMLEMGSAKLAAFPPVAWGVAVDRLRRRVADDLGAGAGGVGAKVRAAPPRIELVKS